VKIFLAVLVIALLTVFTAIPVLADTQTPLEVDTGLPIVGGVGSDPYTDTFYAAGRVWVFYLNGDSDICYKSAVPGGELSDEQVVVEISGLYAVEFCVWYDGATNHVHYARHNMDSEPDTVVYRMGTPGSGGLITWAADEETVSETPADLLTWRTAIAVDELRNPWVAWIDTDGGGNKSIVYVEASTTHNGTWTQDANASCNLSIDAGNETHAWFVNLCPIGSEGDIMQVAWSSENQTAHDTGLYAVVFNSTREAGAIQNVVSDGMLYYDRPDAFDFYDLGSAIYVVYTDNAGAIVFGVKSQIQDWDEATFDFAKEEDGYVFLPTLSGYVDVESGENLLCIANDGVGLYYGLHEYGDALDEWTWGLLWEVSDPADLIMRHNAAYKYSSPVGFSWQYTDNSEGTDTALLWWIDNSNDGAGYYYVAPTPEEVSNNLMKVLFPLDIALGVVLVCMVMGLGENPGGMVKVAIYGAVAFVVVMLLSNLLL